MKAEIIDSLVAIGHWLKIRNFHHTPVTAETHRRVNAEPAHACAIDLTGVFGWSRPFERVTLPIELFELLNDADAIYRVGDWWRCRYCFSTIGGHGFFHSAFPASEDAVCFGSRTYRFITAIQADLRTTNYRWTRGLDIATGCGAAGILLARQNPVATVLLTDANEQAIRLSEINAHLARADNVSFSVGSILDGVTGSFDLIVANSPYHQDTEGGTDSHCDAVGVSREVLIAALDRLAPHGRLFLCGGSGIVEDLGDLLARLNDRRIAGGSASAWSYRVLDSNAFAEDGLAAERTGGIFLAVIKEDKHGHVFRSSW